MRRYGVWGGNPKGTPEEIERCIVEVWSANDWIPHQCHRPRGHGKGGLYCRQHAKQYPAESAQTDNQHAQPATDSTQQAVG